MLGFSVGVYKVSLYYGFRQIPEVVAGGHGSSVGPCRADRQQISPVV